MGKAPLPHNKGNCYPPYTDHYLNCSVPGNFFQVGCHYSHLRGQPRSRTSRGPLAHTFIRRNKSFSEVKNLATGLLIICQKEEIPVLLRKNKHALLTCGTEVTQRFIPYCQPSCVCLPGDLSCLCVICRFNTVHDIVLVLYIVVPW